MKGQDKVAFRLPSAALLILGFIGCGHCGASPTASGGWSTYYAGGKPYRRSGQSRASGGWPTCSPTSLSLDIKNRNGSRSIHDSDYCTPPTDTNAPASPRIALSATVVHQRSSRRKTVVKPLYHNEITGQTTWEKPSGEDLASTQNEQGSGQNDRQLQPFGRVKKERAQGWFGRGRSIDRRRQGISPDNRQVRGSSPVEGGRGHRDGETIPPTLQPPGPESDYLAMDRTRGANDAHWAINDPFPGHPHTFREVRPPYDRALDSNGAWGAGSAARSVPEVPSGGVGGARQRNYQEEGGTMSGGGIAGTGDGCDGAGRARERGTSSPEVGAQEGGNADAVESYPLADDAGAWVGETVNSDRASGNDDWWIPPVFDGEDTVGAAGFAAGSTNVPSVAGTPSAWREELSVPGEGGEEVETLPSKPSTGSTTAASGSAIEGESSSTTGARVETWSSTERGEFTGNSSPGTAWVPEDAGVVAPCTGTYSKKEDGSSAGAASAHSSGLWGDRAEHSASYRWEEDCWGFAFHHASQEQQEPQGAKGTSRKANGWEASGVSANYASTSSSPSTREWTSSLPSSGWHATKTGGPWDGNDHVAPSEALLKAQEDTAEARTTNAELSAALEEQQKSTEAALAAAAISKQEALVATKLLEKQSTEAQQNATLAGQWLMLLGSEMHELRAEMNVSESKSASLVEEVEALKLAVEEEQKRADAAQAKLNMTLDDVAALDEGLKQYMDGDGQPLTRTHSRPIWQRVTNAYLRPLIPSKLKQPLPEELEANNLNRSLGRALENNTALAEASLSKDAVIMDLTLRIRQDQLQATKRKRGYRALKLGITNLTQELESKDIMLVISMVAILKTGQMLGDIHAAMLVQQSYTNAMNTLLKARDEELRAATLERDEGATRETDIRDSLRKTEFALTATAVSLGASEQCVQQWKDAARALGLTDDYSGEGLLECTQQLVGEIHAAIEDRRSTMAAQAASGTIEETAIIALPRTVPHLTYADAERKRKRTRGFWARVANCLCCRRTSGEDA